MLCTSEVPPDPVQPTMPNFGHPRGAHLQWGSLRTVPSTSLLCFRNLKLFQEPKIVFRALHYFQFEFSGAWLKSSPSLCVPLPAHTAATHAAVPACVRPSCPRTSHPCNPRHPECARKHGAAPTLSPTSVCGGVSACGWVLVWF